MRFLRKLFFIILAFIAVVLLLAIVLPSRYSVVRSVEINKQEEGVYARVADLSRWKEWDPWFRPDTKEPNVIQGAAGEEGQTRNRGEAKVSIIDVLENEMLLFDRQLISPVRLHSLDSVAFEKTAIGTLVTWTSKADLDYPLGRIYGLFNKSARAKRMEASLAALKEISESETDQPPKPVSVPAPNIPE